ncbi:EAL domain-containing protein [Belnapia sp. T18]|uniref:EAL domain-containing protein n=1 Tax=Belnapia arida TaxID=2804533 RepID=A0ABS1TXU7_9PROT|nr:EAL domain-containing protein [Belnapia arida]MBL6077281.1 EAL domain-containing protein [Belnapia arida]
MTRVAGPPTPWLAAHSEVAPLLGLQGDAADLAAGLSNGEVSVHYQPVVRFADRRPVMVEALARWHKPPTLISPDRFVPLAESSGLVRALSMLVATRAAAELAPLWQRLRLSVSVNLPLGQLLLPDLPAWLHRALRAGGLHPRQVALELTETTEVRDRSALRRALMRLREAGHRVLLDDIILHDERSWLFGLPFAALKLDRSLVEQLPGDAHARREVRRMVRLAEASGKQVIAEGVSDQRIWQVVRGLGVHHAQGYLVSRPLPAEALARWHGRWRGSVRS